MRYPTADQSEGARAQKLGFGLTRRALRFAHLYAENPSWTISRAAREAGFSDRARGAHVRGCELMRDLRVIRAILHFGALAFSRARAKAIEKLRDVAEDKHQYWMQSYWGEHELKRLRKALDQVEPHVQRIERVYGRGAHLLARSGRTHG